jgi:hypothetical protein
MITNDGVELLSKYLVGQATSYASYIAVGSGARPTSNNQPITVVTSGGIVGTVSGSGPYTTTISLSSGYWAYLEVGDVITATSTSTGSLGSGTVTVTAINSPTQIAVSSTSTMTSGTGLTNIKVYSNLTSQLLTTKKNLDFEVARFPISSRSYAIEKQIVNPTSLYIVSPTSIIVNIASGHPFGIGDAVNISGVLIPVTGPTAFKEVNGLYTITAISSTTFTATIYDPTVPTYWDATMYSTPYTGLSYNGNVFYATVFTKQISLTSEMSDITKYNISELGLYSLGSNQYSASGNSRMLLGFSDTEGWEYYTGTTFSTVPTNSVSIPISTPYICSTSDSYWNGSSVNLRQEFPRIFSQSLIVPGALSNYSSGTTFTSNYIRLRNPGVDLSKSSGLDEIRLAYSIMNAVTTPTALPTALYIMFEFVCSDGITTSKILFSDTGTTVIYPNRYNVLTKKMSDFVSSSGFDWAKVTSVNVYCSLEPASGTPTNDYAVVIDGLRFENTGTENPLYALTAYTIVNNTTASPIDKVANSNDLINFRMDLAVGK